MPFDSIQQTKISERTQLRTKWEVDLSPNVSFVKEFAFRNLPEGLYVVKYNSARDGSKPVLYSFHIG